MCPACALVVSYPFGCSVLYRMLAWHMKMELENDEKI